MGVALIHLRPVLNSIASYTELSPVTVYRTAYEAMESRTDGTVARVLHPGELIGDEDGIDSFICQLSENLVYVSLCSLAIRNKVDIESIVDTETHEAIEVEISDLVGDMIDTNKVVLTGL